MSLQPEGMIGPVDLVLKIRGKEVVMGASIAGLAREAAIKRLAPCWFPYPHFSGGGGRKEILKYLIENPTMRQSLGGPEEVDEYTRNFLDIDIPGEP